MKNSDENHLIFLEIINCYSPVYDSVLGELFIKHLSQIESINIEKQYVYALNKAIENKIPTNDQKLQSLIKDGLWTKKEEDSLKDNLTFVQGMRDNISREFLLSRRKLLRKELVLTEKKIESLLNKKDYLLGFTAERYARQQYMYHQMKQCFYKDDKFIERFSIEELQDEETYDKIRNIYEGYIKRVNIETIKEITISPFFTNLFYMAGDNAYDFFGKPIVSLTGFQRDLFLYGKYFKNLMGQYGDKLPKDMSENPNDIIEFFEITQNVEKSGILKDDGKDVSTTSIMGATKEDMRLMGIDPAQVKDIGKEIAKSGKGFLSKDDLYKLNG